MRGVKAEIVEGFAQSHTEQFVGGLEQGQRTVASMTSLAKNNGTWFSLDQCVASAIDTATDGLVDEPEKAARYGADLGARDEWKRLYEGGGLA